MRNRCFRDYSHRRNYDARKDYKITVSMIMQALMSNMSVYFSV